jgi:hypothetical protein
MEAGVVCPHCGAVSRRDYHYCPACGRPLPVARHAIQGHGDPELLDAEFANGGDIPDPIFWDKWIGGVILPPVMLGYAVMIFITRHAYVPRYGRSGGSTDLYGDRAVALGVVVLSVALFVHLHCWWGNIYWRSTWPVVAKVIVATSFIVSLIYLFIRVSVPG